MFHPLLPRYLLSLVREKEIISKVSTSHGKIFKTSQIIAFDKVIIVLTMTTSLLPFKSL